MTVETRPSTTKGGGGLGLFATAGFKLGETILDEESILVRLAPRSGGSDDRSQEAQMLSELLVQSPTNKVDGQATQQKNKTNKRLKTESSSSVGKCSAWKGHDDGDPSSSSSLTLWDSIVVPGSVPSVHRGTFKGMVQACVACNNNKGCGDDNASEDERILFDLYHQSLENPAKEEERTIVDLSAQAVRYIREHAAAAGSKIQKALLTADDGNSAFEKKLQRVALIWACNAFDGGRVYSSASRINHSCDPNAVVQRWMQPSSSKQQQLNDDKNNNNGAAGQAYQRQQHDDDDRQLVKAVTDLSPGEEISISYLGIFLYAEHRVRRDILLRTKFFECRCVRCTSTNAVPDVATAIPCPKCHPRTGGGGRQLEEDVQYDDDQTVHYAFSRAKDASSSGGKNSIVFECEGCRATFDAEAEKSTIFARIHRDMRAAVDKVVAFLEDYEAKRKHRHRRRNTKNSSNDCSCCDEEEDSEAAVESDLLEQHLAMASSVLGARHWATNLLLLLHLDQSLQRFHVNLLANPGTEPDMGTVAEFIDSLERICRFVESMREGKQVTKVDGVGHLLSRVVIGVARALVSLGDVKSQKYAAQWLDKITHYVNNFELDDGIQKVVAALRVAWKRQQPE